MLGFCLLALLGIAPGARQEPALPNGSTVRIVAVGDICLAGGVDRKMRARGRGYPFAAMRDTLRSADIAFGNLECVLADGGEPIPKKYNFRGRPIGALALAEAGFDIVSVANNHTLDYGREGLAETLTHLRRAKVIPVGAGNTLAQAHRMQIVRRGGLRIGFLAYLGMFPPLLPPVTDAPSVAMAYLPRLRADIRSARSHVDFLVVSMHAGVEHAPSPSARQQAIARAAIEAGADAVVGHHPHVVQQLAFYRGKPIFYSLGNFVFNPSQAFLRNPKGRWSALGVIELTRGARPRAHLLSLRLVDAQPRPRSFRSVDRIATDNAF